MKGVTSSTYSIGKTKRKWRIKGASCRVTQNNKVLTYTPRDQQEEREKKEELCGSLLHLNSTFFEDSHGPQVTNHFSLSLFLNRPPLFLLPCRFLFCFHLLFSFVAFRFICLKFMKSHVLMSAATCWEAAPRHEEFEKLSHVFSFHFDFLFWRMRCHWQRLATLRQPCQTQCNELQWWIKRRGGHPPFRSCLIC